MKTVDAPDELAALARLREHEIELDRQLENARLEAARIVAEAQRAARELREQADAELLAEVQRLRQTAASALERSLATVREETGQKTEALRQSAGRSRERALGLLLSRVAGSDTP